MSNQHTPAPWTVRRIPDEPDGDERFSYWIDSAKHTPIADVRAYPNGLSEANAVVLALAPDMLRLLQTLTEHASETYPHFESERGQAELAEARALIARAGRAA